MRTLSTLTGKRMITLITGMISETLVSDWWGIAYCVRYRENCVCKIWTLICSYALTDWGFSSRKTFRSITAQWRCVWWHVLDCGNMAMHFRLFRRTSLHCNKPGIWLHFFFRYQVQDQMNHRFHLLLPHVNTINVVEPPTLT